MADYIYYVNPAATTGGDGTADTLTGGTCAYQTLNAAITARAGTHGSGNTITYRCSGNTGSWIDSTGVIVNGHTEDSIIIEGYNGNYTGRQTGDNYDNTNCYALEVSTASVRTIALSDNNVTIRYIQCDNTSATNFYQTIYNDFNGDEDIIVDSCRIRCLKANTSKVAAALTFRGATTGTNVIKNCTIEGNGSTSTSSRGVQTGSSAGFSLLNCTIYNFGRGISDEIQPTLTVQNTAIAGCTDDWYNSGSWTGTFSYNADSADGDTPGTNNQTLSTTLTDEFTSPSTGDFTVASNGASNNIWDNGTSGGSIPTVDINGTSRSNYSIGAWEYVSAGGAYTLDVTAGALTLTGGTVTAAKGSKLNVTAGALGLTGQTVTMTYGQAYSLEVTAGALSLTGGTITASAGKRLAVTAGSLSLTGGTITAAKDSKLAVTAGALGLTGQTVTLTYTPVGAYDLTVLPGELALNGQSITFNRTYALQVTAGSLGLTGQTITMDYAVPSAYTLEVTAGELALTGQTITATHSGAVTLADIYTLLEEIHAILGLTAGSPMTVTPTSRVAGSISQTISGDGTTSTTVTRDP